LEHEKQEPQEPDEYDGNYHQEMWTELEEGTAHDRKNHHWFAHVRYTLLVQEEGRSGRY